jgi:hypothetical protein
MQTISFCRVCQGKNLISFFDLGEHPPANLLLKSPDEKEDFYPLSLSYCKNCSLVQLNETVEPEKLFSKYVWVTGTAKTTREYSEHFYKELIARSNLSKEGYVLDVGSNDGTFLLPFMRAGFRVLGVDPAENIVEMANKNGIPTLCRFFGAEVAREIVKEYGKASIVFARNVLPHVANTRDFTNGLEICLADDGILAIEVHYGGAILDGLQYDSIYHEHLCYFTLKTLEYLLAGFGLYIFDIGESPISGGSIVVYASKDKRIQTQSVEKYHKEEESHDINEFKTWKDFASKSYAHREKLKDILQKLSSDGKIIIGYGASARSSTLLNFCGIDGRIIKSIADQNPLKQRFFTAGTHILIESPEAALARNPDIVVILAWNFAEEIMDVLKNKFGYTGKVVVPLPGEPRVVNV